MERKICSPAFLIFIVEKILLKELKRFKLTKALVYIDYIQLSYATHGVLMIDTDCQTRENNYTTIKLDLLMSLKIILE